MRVSRRPSKLPKTFGAVIVLAALCSPAVAAPPAQRIMSLKLCTDQILMDLASPSRIASLSFLSREKAALKIWPQAARIPVNHNTAEDILAVRPDLVLTDAYTSPAMRAVLEKSGARIVEIPPAEDFPAIAARLRLVGDALDARPRAEMLIARMDATLNQLAQTKPAHPIRVAGWGGGGFLPGRTSLFNAIVEAAGGTNIAGGIKDGGGYYDVESLIAARPDVLAYGDDYIDTPSLRADQNTHPVLLRLYAKRRIVYPAALYGCGVARSADAAVSLRAALKAAAP